MVPMLNQALLGQNQKRFAHRAAANLELRSQRRIGEFFARLEAAVEQRVAQDRGHVFAQSGRPKAGK